MLLVAPGLATRNKRPLEPKASPLIENEEAGMRKKKQGDAGDLHGRHPTKTPWISCDMSQGRLTHVPACYNFFQAVQCGVLQ